VISNVYFTTKNCIFSTPESYERPHGAKPPHLFPDAASSSY
jgi:hypothetical protein